MQLKKTFMPAEGDESEMFSFILYIYQPINHHLF